MTTEAARTYARTLTAIRQQIDDAKKAPILMKAASLELLAEQLYGALELVGERLADLEVTTEGLAHAEKTQR